MFVDWVWIKVESALDAWWNPVSTSPSIVIEVGMRPFLRPGRSSGPRRRVVRTLLLGVAVLILAAWWWVWFGVLKRASSSNNKGAESTAAENNNNEYALLSGAYDSPQERN